MSAFAEGLVNGFRLAGALIVLPALAAWFVLRVFVRLDGVHRCYRLWDAMNEIARSDYD